MVSEGGAVGESPAVRVRTGDGGGHGPVLDAARTASSSMPVVEVGNRALSSAVIAIGGGRSAYHVGCGPIEARTIVERTEAGELPTDGTRHVGDVDEVTDGTIVLVRNT
ncbi:hypothetical protein [Halalkalicoccus ordinarius]|uniref:hypothetical protein n=1 Tax=Halalkalicoccus ordinarius TaxID=3116651 RepID=UPI00300F49D3